MLTNVLTRRIEWGDCDPAGIVFNPNFFRYFDHCTTMLYEAAGWPKQEMVDRFGIVGCPLVDTRASFRSPCRYGDEVTITTEVRGIGTTSFEIAHTLKTGERLCVEVVEKRVWAGKDPDTGRIRSQPLPDEVIARFRAGD